MATVDERMSTCEMYEKKCIIVIPVYKKELTETEYKCLENYREKLPGFRIVFIAPVDIDDSYYAKRWEGISIIKFDTWSADSLNDYNRLLMTPEFYNRFSDYEYMFILQLDGWLIKGEEELKRFLQMGFDYIGAPWRDGGYRYYKRVIRGANYIRFLRYFTGETICRVGNGGVSLRRVKRMEAFFRAYEKEKVNWEKAEDIFISFYGQKRKFRLRIPPVETAKEFSLETDMKEEILEGNLPMAVHKWERYFPELLSVLKII